MPVRIWDVIDILVVALLLYSIYRLLKGSIAFNIVVGILLLYVMWGIVGVLEMPLLSEILGQFISVGFIALIIIFQPEIRRFLLYLGNTTLKGRADFLQRFLNTSLSVTHDDQIDAIRRALIKMSKNRTGALIVFPKQLGEDSTNESGQYINAEISEDLILSIFNRKSPLHDGAMIVHGDKIKRVSVVLPISSRSDLPAKIGLRHRAAIGASENSDTSVFVVSEETGQISFAFKGALFQNVSEERLESLLREHVS